MKEFKSVDAFGAYLANLAMGKAGETTEAPVKAGVKLHASATLLKRKPDGFLYDHNDQRVMVAFPDGSELR